MAAPDGLRFDTGRPCLDLMTTVGARRGANPVERLDSPARLREWLEGTGLLPAGDTLPITAAWLPHFHELREVIYRAVHAVTWGELPSKVDIKELNARLEHPVPGLRLVRTSENTLRLAVRRGADHRSFLAVLAADTVTLLAGEERTRLRECAATICGVIYLDLANGRERVWCSQSVCGNRERTARHRQKARGAPTES